MGTVCRMKQQILGGYGLHFNIVGGGVGGTVALPAPPVLMPLHHYESPLKDQDFNIFLLVKQLHCGQPKRRDTLGTK